MSYLVDVLQQVQSLLEVVLVGSSVVVADVQLWRGDREQKLWSYSYHLCMRIIWSTGNLVSLSMLQDFKSTYWKIAAAEI